MRRFWYLLMLVTLVVPLLTACAVPATPQVVEKQVVVEKPVIQTVVVEKQVAVEKQVVQTVVVPQTVVVQQTVEKWIYVTPTAEPVPTTPVKGGTLRITYFQPWSGLDVHVNQGAEEQLIARQVWDSLLGYDPQHNVIPNLAETWKISDDGMTYTFNLRKGVKFSNGKELKSEDVVYSLKRCADKAVSPLAAFFKKVTAFEAVDDYTVKITTSEPDAPLLEKLAYFNTAIYPKDHVPSDKDGYIGTGPFTIDSNVFQEQVVLVRNPNYWNAGKEGLPYLDKVTINRIEDPLARVGALLSGQAELIFAPDSASRASLLTTPGITVYPGMTHYKGLVLNALKVKAFASPLVREAIDVGLNRKEIVDGALDGVGEPILGDINQPGTWSFYDKAFVKPEGDLTKAADLLKQAGFDKGFAFSVGTYGNFSSDVKAAQLIQATMKKLNIDVKIENIDPGIWVEKVYKGDIEGVLQGLGGNVEPDHDYRWAFHPTDAIVKPVWDNKQIGDMIEQASTTIDQKKRTQIYADIVEALHAEGKDTYSTFLPLFREPLDIALNSKSVHGFVDDGYGNMTNLKSMWMTAK